VASPYECAPDRAFWKPAVANAGDRWTDGLHSPKFAITEETAIFTAGSCFAQHLGRRLRLAQYRVVDSEPMPEWIPDDVLTPYGYRLYSARYGNIYTMRQFRLLIDEALGIRDPGDEIIWNRNDRFYDALRPNVEPEGLDSRDDVQTARAYHLQAVRDALNTADVFVFTLGLTESWVDHQTGTAFPVAPGILADPAPGHIIQFHNFAFGEIWEDFIAVRTALRGLRPQSRILLTVSPVPLVATATNAHVAIANSHSKSVLRAICGEACAAFDDVDYFPSYEIISAPMSRGTCFAPNMRSVTPEGVDKVMDVFFAAYRGINSKPDPDATGARDERPEDDLICEELLIEASGR